jgi:hypothetical protein
VAPSSRVPALELQSPEFKPPPPKKKNQTKPKNIQRGRQGGERKGREKENANMVIMIYLFFFFFQKAKNFFFLAFLWFWGLNPGTHEC